jgi:CubicO group peptidase (beta-lactamase class C family)
MHRRSFLQLTASVPLLVSDWRSKAPSGYLAELRRLMQAAPVPGAVIGTVTDFKPSWIAPLGVRAEGMPDPITPSTLFQAASLTKQVTAYAAFALRAQGKLDIDRPLVEYVDDLHDPVARTVTARHVLSHSSGFPNWRFPQNGKPAGDLVPQFKPGSQYRYSGEGYFYLQRVLERITGTGFARVVRELVFTPLNMSSSTLVWDPATLARTAVPHGEHGKPYKDWGKQAQAVRALAARKSKPVEDLLYQEYAEVPREAGDPVLPNWMVPNAAASMVTSAEDYARFVSAAIRNPEIGQQQVAINEFLGWGLGWAVERSNGHSYVWQWGDNGGFKNIVLAEPSTGNGIFVFTNGDAGARVYDRVLTHATGQDHPLLFWL